METERKRKLHVIGPPHTIVDESHTHCALTEKVLLFARMMRPVGFTVVEYSNASSESGADVHVQILSAGELRAASAQLESTFRARLIRALSGLTAPGEIVCHVFGADAAVMAALPWCLHVELVTGYCPVDSACPYRVYESAAWMHWHFGRRHLVLGRNYEFVASTYYDCSDWDVAEQPPETPTVLFFGRLVESSGLATVLAVARAMPSVVFVLSGQGDDSLASEPNTVYAPPVCGRERSAVLGAATAVLAPSELIEPSGGSTVAAQMCGTPVICSSFGAFAETVEDGKTGYLCHTLADFVVAVARAALLDRRYIAWRARRAFSLEAVGRRYSEIFSDIADVRGDGWYTAESHKFGCYAPMLAAVPRPDCSKLARIVSDVPGCSKLAPRVVNVVIFNEAASYEHEMIHELRRLNRMRRVTQLFVVLDVTVHSMRLDGDVLRVPGVETYAPGILHKTVEAMKYYMREAEFDFLVRSNVSTVIDFAALVPVLVEFDATQIVYASTRWFHFIEKIYHRDGIPSEGIREKCTFAAGTNIVLSRPAVEHIVANADGLEMYIPDDVAIGKELLRVCEPHQITPAEQYCDDKPGAIVYRNRTDFTDFVRTVDILRMRKIVDRLLAIAPS